MQENGRETKRYGERVKVKRSGEMKRERGREKERQVGVKKV